MKKPPKGPKQMEDVMSKDSKEDNLSEAEIRKLVRDSFKHEREVETILDKAFELFINLEDTRNPDLVETALYFVREHGFDYRELPERLRRRVIYHLQEEEKVSYSENQAALLGQLEKAYEWLGYY